ncbi:MAG: exported protein of unknown function [Candidatus Saccharibacteria bacterium]|nr:exported protein of unknown function [Candidatus Saccharibacteria bacterium]
MQVKIPPKLARPSSRDHLRGEKGYVGDGIDLRYGYKQLMITVAMKILQHRNKVRLGVATLGAVLLIFLGLFFTLTTVYGAQGGTGPGTGCTRTPPDACTTSGTDWMKFSSASNSNPTGFQAFIKNADGSRTLWSNVATKCRSTGNNKVWVFVAYYNDGSYRFKGLNYTAGNASHYQNTQATVATVHSDYASANFHDPQWNWGTNVAWFCWNDAPPNPPWSVTATTSTPNAYAEPGELITWTHKVTVDSGANKTNAKVIYQYQNGGNFPAGGGGGTAGWSLPSGSSPGDPSSQTSTYLVQASDFGKQLCRTTTATPGANTGGTATSTPSCVTIGKKPKVQVHGNDLILGRAFTGGAPQLSSANTSISSLNPQNGQNPPNNVFGSWVEYGIFATKTSLLTPSGLGSGSAFSGGSKVSDACSYSLLTFVNATTSNPKTSCNASTPIGGYATGRTIPDIASDFPIVSGTPVYDDTIATPQGLYTSDASTDPITVAAGGAKNIAKGEWIVINAPNADVTIANNVTYDNSALQSIYDIPQMVIIAKDIYINPNVKQVDAWLIAQGSNIANTGILDTCHVSADYTTALTTNATQTGACDNVLQVNGPVMAQKLWLRRTGGATTNDPAEVFNLRPDAYMWAFARASTTGRVQTVYNQELPPRF